MPACRDQPHVLIDDDPIIHQKTVTAVQALASWEKNMLWPVATVIDPRAALEKIKKWFKYSATIVWARIVAFGGAFIVALGTFADLFDLPGIRENVQVLLAPRYLPYYIIVIAIVTELARRAR